MQQKEGTHILTFVLLFLLLSSVFLGLGVAIGLVRSLLLEFRD